MDIYKGLWCQIFSFSVRAVIIGNFVSFIQIKTSQERNLAWTMFKMPFLSFLFDQTTTTSCETFKNLRTPISGFHQQPLEGEVKVANDSTTGLKGFEMSICSEDFCLCVSHFQCLDHAWLLEKDIGMAVRASFFSLFFFFSLLWLLFPNVLFCPGWPSVHLFSHLSDFYHLSDLSEFRPILPFLSPRWFLFANVWLYETISLCRMMSLCFCSMILILNNAQVIKTENLRKFLARRRWQRCGQVWSKSITITFTSTIINVITD